MSDADLNLAMDQPVEFPAYPWHTQSVERAVKLVTDAASQVEGEESRHGHLLSVLASRESRKDFTTKREYEYKTE